MSVTVCYGYKRLKIKLEPSSLLGEARDTACRMVGHDSLSFGLSRNGKMLDLTVPFRLSNLVANASVDLVPAQKPSKPVRIKLRIPGKPDFVGTFAPDTSVGHILQAAGVPNSRVRLGTHTLPPGETLLRAGVTGAVVLVVDEGVSPPSRSALPIQSKENEIGACRGREISDIDEKDADNPNPSPVRDSQGQSEQQSLSLKNTIQEDRPEELDTVISRPRNDITSFEPPAEMTREQFMTYYDYLHAQATNQKPKKKQITKTTVRIKFPDGICIDATFKRQARGLDVYETVRDHLRRREESFELVPRGLGGVLLPEQNLIDDCKYGGRVLLVFRPIGSQGQSGQPILSDKALSKIFDPKPDGLIEDGSGVKREETSSSSKPLGTHSSGVPKWLRLHK